MKITLTAPQTIILAPQKTETFSTLTVVRMVDSPTQKVVKAVLQEVNKPVILWQGTAYDNIGQWTDADVQSRLLAIYGATAS